MKRGGAKVCDDEFRLTLLSGLRRLDDGARLTLLRSCHLMYLCCCVYQGS